MLRCFNLDDRLIKMRTYSDKNIYELKNNLEQVLYENTSINFNYNDNTSGVVYQKRDSSNSDSAGYISGTQQADREENYGFTIESNVVFPSYDMRFGQQLVDRSGLLKSSLFGMHSASTESPDDTSFYAVDFPNFQVLAIREREFSKNAYFMLTSSNNPYPFPTLTSSIFFDVYDNQEWHFSVRLKPAGYPLAGVVSGSELGVGDKFDVTFRGVNAVSDNIQNSFILTSSIDYLTGSKILNSAKRLYVGAQRNNITGSLTNKADTKIMDLKYWARYLNDGALNQHLFDDRNAGLSSSYQNISALDPLLTGSDVLNLNTLALHWTFGNITGSDNSGNFYYVTDMSSGSVAAQSRYQWLGGIVGAQHTGYGYGFATSSLNVKSRDLYNSLRFVDPESVASSDMVNIVSDDELVFGIQNTPPTFFQSIEKSMYNAVSEEMLTFFAGAIDFNNIIGERVNRYRARYKIMEKLRQIFFERVTTVSDVEKYVDYYKWFDDAISSIISQLLPASTELAGDISNVVESHVLERNKYKTPFPTIEFKEVDLEAIIYSDMVEKIADFESPEPSSPRVTNIRQPFWRDRAIRTSPEITSGDSTIDAQRVIVRDQMASPRPTTQRAVTLKTIDGELYERLPWFKKYRNSKGKISVEILDKDKPYRLQGDIRTANTIKGGTNFEQKKNLQFADWALYPAGPVNTDNDLFIPTNTLLAPMSELIPLGEIQSKDSESDVSLNRKRKRHFKTYYGREFEDGLGYYNTLSTLSLPFNIIESDVVTGYNQQVVSRVSGGIEITNIHNDVYGPEMEKPMQGRFTEHNVGGRQSRHVPLNDGTDTYLTRPEAWKILLGTCTTIGGVSGAIGMVGADYPWPEANAVGAIPYPMTGAQKAVYYRDFTAKRPVNIRNISQSATNVLGNYSHNYQIVQSVGSYSNPRQFIKNNSLLTLPLQITQSPSSSQARSCLDIRRTYQNHFEFIPNYSIAYMSASKNNSIFKGRFAAHPGIEVSSPGYLDFKAMEYSVYNALNYRAWSVLRPFQPMATGTVSEPAGIGTPGIRVSDIHGNDFGLRVQLTRHSGKFGRAYNVSLPGKSYVQNPSYNKINRNTKIRLLNDSDGNVITSSQYDNFWVQHQIPRSDRQYAWITGAIKYSPDIRYYGYSRVDGVWAGYYSGSNIGYAAYFDFITSSDVGRSNSITQPCNSLNYYILDPVDESFDNNLGLSLASNVVGYYNNALLDVYSIIPTLNKKADYFNLLMSQRRAAFKTRNVMGFSNNQRKVLLKHRAESKLTLQRSSREALKSYTFKPVTFRGRKVYLNADIGNINTTLCTTYNNEFEFFSDEELNENCDIDTSTQGYALGQLLYLCESNEDYKLNWILYDEMLFPSKKNEFLSQSSERVGYDNKYWRSTAGERYTLGRTIALNSWGSTVSQSSWPLDAPLNFLTRSKAASINLNINNALRRNNRTGELQNEYFHVLSGAFASSGLRRAPNLSPSALYSRKHLMPQTRTVVSPSGMQIPETSSAGYLYTSIIQPYAGEAWWDAPTQAGILIKTGSVTAFHSKSSAPWFGNYDDFKEDIRTISKDYAIVPEFRISSHVEEYKKLGINANNKYDTFEIVGTAASSATSSFYKDYSNSEFMGKFSDISSMSGLKPSELMLVCSASIRFNPYKGFYPAQRTVELVSQFSKSYGDSLRAIRGTGSQIRPGDDGGIRPLMQSMYSPGVLFNSIKSGIAVDYPIVSDGSKVRRDYFGSAVSSSKHTAWMTTTTGSNSEIEGYTGGVFWDYRVPFEAIISPEKYIAGLQFIDMESHPSASISNLTSAFVPQSTDDIYTLMASNWVSQVGKFFLKDEGYSKLESEIVTDDLRFPSGSIYGSRIVMRRSVGGIRSYASESGS